MIFAYGDSKSAKVIANVIGQFSLMSGMDINVS